MNAYTFDDIPYFLDNWNKAVSYGGNRLFLSDDVHPQGITRAAADE